MNSLTGAVYLLNNMNCNTIVGTSSRVQKGAWWQRWNGDEKEDALVQDLEGEREVALLWWPDAQRRKRRCGESDEREKA